MVRLAAFLVMVSLPFLIAQWISPVVYSGVTELQRPAQSRRPAQRTVPRPRIDYSQFSHVTHVTNQKLGCDSCHKFPTKNWKEVRTGDAAFPDVAEFPEHSTCLSCHRQQFFARERPAPVICSNCHVKVTPRDTIRFLFPSLGDVTTNSPSRNLPGEFAVSFPHDKHLDVVGMYAPYSKPRFVTAKWQQKTSGETSEPKSCVVCHQTIQPQGNSDEEYVSKPPRNLGDAFWLKKGTFKTSPNSHTVCFTCHSTDSGIAPLPADCHSCHKLVPQQGPVKNDFDTKLAETIGVKDRNLLSAWQRRTSSGAFRHEAGEHPSLSCTKCHQVATMNTLDVKTQTVPVTSCGGAEGCHITSTSDEGGILNYEIDQKKATPTFVCVKCHITLGTQAVPTAHVRAIPTPKPK